MPDKLRFAPEGARPIPRATRLAMFKDDATRATADLAQLAYRLRESRFHRDAMMLEAIVTLLQAWRETTPEEREDMDREGWIAEGPSRGTDEQLMTAIWTVSGGSFRLARKIWATPTEKDIEQILVVLAARNLDPLTFSWGAARTAWTTPEKAAEIIDRVRKGS